MHVLEDELINLNQVGRLEVLLTSAQHIFPTGFFEAGIGQEGGFSFEGDLNLLFELFGRDNLYFFLEGPDKFIYLVICETGEAGPGIDLFAQVILLND